MKDMPVMTTPRTDAALLLDAIDGAEAILVGAASGMSAAAGHRFYYERDAVFEDVFGPLAEKYGYSNAFEGVYYPYPTEEERWAFFATLIHHIYEAEEGKPYHDLARLLDGRNFHILTTNQDTLFERVFSPDKISAIQGDWRYFQCRSRCHDGLYWNRDEVETLFHSIEDAAIPGELVPRCPRCGGPMEPWVRGYDFLEGAKYRDEYRKVQEFLGANRDRRLLFLELGVGRMTPMFIQEPFWNLAYSLPKAFYLSVNPRDAIMPQQLADKGALIHEDIAHVLEYAVALADAPDGR